jgi:hypothetical protein
MARLFDSVRPEKIGLRSQLSISAKALIEGSGVFGNFACLEFKLTHYLNVWARSSARCMGFALVFWVICSAQLKPSVRMMD